MQRSAALAASFLLLSTLAATAATDDALTCGDRTVADGMRIAACTRAILAGSAAAEDSAMLRFNRAKAYERQGDLRAAVGDWNEVVRLQPATPLWYIERGSLLVEMRDFARGIGDLDEAIRLDPQSRLGYFWRATAHIAGEDVDQAIADYDAAIRLDPTNAAYHVLRGDAHQARGDDARASADYREALRLDPSDARAATKLEQSLKENVARESPPETPAVEPKAAEAPPAAEPRECIGTETDFKQDGKANTFVIALTNSCEKRFKCAVSAYVVGAQGPASGRGVLILGRKSQGAAARKSYVMKVKEPGGMANVSRKCTEL